MIVSIAKPCTGVLQLFRWKVWEFIKQWWKLLWIHVLKSKVIGLPFVSLVYFLLRNCVSNIIVISHGYYNFNYRFQLTDFKIRVLQSRLEWVTEAIGRVQK